VVLFVFSIYFHDFDIGFWNCFWTVWKLNSYLIQYQNHGNKLKKQTVPHYRNSYLIQYHNHRKRQNRWPLTHKYMTAHFPWLVQVLQ
jgi:hypothetical protein